MRQNIIFNSTKRIDLLRLNNIDLALKKSYIRTKINGLIRFQENILVPGTTFLKQKKSIKVGLLYGMLSSDNICYVFPQIEIVKIISYRNLTSYEAFRIENPRIKGINTIHIDSSSSVCSKFISLIIPNEVVKQVPIIEIINEAYDLLSMFFKENNIEHKITKV